MKQFLIWFGIIVGIVVLSYLCIMNFAENMSPGNIPTYQCVTSKYKGDLLYRYCDTFLVRHPEYVSPLGDETRENWKHLRIISLYFRDEPSEVYDVDVGSFTCVRSIVQMKDGVIWGSLDSPTKEDHRRMEKRLELVIREVERLIDQSGVPDSLKYY